MIKVGSTKTVVHRINCLVYGESGIGKTTLCGTAPNPLIVSIEGGLLTLADKDLPVIEVSKDITKSRKEINEIHEWLDKSKEADQYDTVCIDSISEMAELILNEEMNQTYANGTKMSPQAAYGTMAEVMAMAIRGYRDIKKHTVFTAKVRKVVEKATGVIRFFPSVPGQMLLNNLPYMFDEVFRMDFGKTKDKQQYRYIDTVGSRQFICKDRSGKLAAQEPPDLTRVFAKILKPNADANANANTQEAK